MFSSTNRSGCPQCGSLNVVAMTVWHKQGMISIPEGPAAPAPVPSPWPTKIELTVWLVGIIAAVHNAPAAIPTPIVILWAIALRSSFLIRRLWRADRQRHENEKEHSNRLKLHRQVVAWWGLMQVSLCHDLVWVPRDLEDIQVPPHQPVFAGLDQDRRVLELAKSLAVRSLEAADDGKGKSLDWSRLWDEQPSGTEAA